MHTDSPRATLPALIRQGLGHHRADALVERVNGRWTAISSASILMRVENLACALRDMGLDGGDRVALISPNRIDWIVTDFAILMAGCVVVPIFPSQALDQILHIVA
ncbi:MAG: AMP-binding protein, partial [Candidatus Eremiobacteraeota bacterium]|nr:AMP-binding protein [Candidatus Eremiobacteraeota bacterium]